MTEPTPHSDTFDSLLDPAHSNLTSDAAPTPSTSRRRWVLPAATLVLGLLGVSTRVAAALAPGSLGAADATAPTTTVSPTPTGTPTSKATPTPAPTVSDRSTPMPVSERADPAWITRIAATGNIPERALAAYAGATIAVSDTHPNCGLGWNTLAAIGLVETEHGTMHDARIAANGVTAPTIIGIPLNGDGVAAIRDTDGGSIDEDTTWDRAVGPMQFIPETWKQYAVDGNGDGKTDINQIDDAALTAAVYLCTAGGDLTQPENWIIAINAYNPSVDYNNRVAEAANHYATLR